MSDFNKFVSGRPPDPFENPRIDPIEADKRQKEDPYTGLPEENGLPLAFGALTVLLKKSFQSLEYGDHSLQLFFDPEQLLERVLELKNLLQALAEEDLSHDPGYTQQLSVVWHTLLDDCNSILGHSGSPPAYAKLAKQFLEKLTNYPPQEDHTLGYYLSAGMGKEWTPFPFMAILQKLHEECLENPSSATLIQWIVALTEILNAQNGQND